MSRVISKSKGLPRQAEVAQGVPGRLRPRIFLTFRHYKGGRSSAKRTGRLYPRNNPWYPLSEVESTSGHMVLSGVPRKKSPVTPLGIDPGTVRPVAQHLNHYATPGPPMSRVLGEIQRHSEIRTDKHAVSYWNNKLQRLNLTGILATTIFYFNSVLFS